MIEESRKPINQVPHRRRKLEWIVVAILVICLATYSTLYFRLATVSRISTLDHELLGKIRSYNSPFLGRLFVPAAWIEQKITNLRIAILVRGDPDGDGVVDTIQFQYIPPDENDGKILFRARDSD